MDVVGCCCVVRFGSCVVVDVSWSGYMIIVELEWLLAGCLKVVLQF